MSTTPNPTNWSLEFIEKASKDFNKLDAEIYRRVTEFVDHSLLPANNPRVLGKQLSGNLKEFWSYRIGDYRLICHIVDHKLLIVAVRVAHRSKVYKNVHFLKSSA